MAQLDDAAAVAEPEVPVTEPDDSKVQDNANDPTSYYPDDVPAEEPEEEGDEVEDIDEDEDDEEGEPEEVIAPPVSLKAEEKESFAQLPPEAQRWASEVLSRRDKEVQTGLETARQAQRQAEQSAADTVAETQRDYAERFENFVSAFAPKPPDPRMAQQNPGQYIALKAQYDAEAAEFEQLKQQISGIRSQADQHDQASDQQFYQERHKQLMSFPEYASEETRRDFLAGIDQFGNDMGYEPEEMANATFRDITNLKRWKEDRADAEKWREHVAKRNERPRKAGKFAKAAPAGAQAPKVKQSANPLASLYPDDV